MNQGSNAPKIPKAFLKISDVIVKMVIDISATTDILDEATYCNIHQNEDTELQPTVNCLFAYGLKHKVTTIHVVQWNHGSLLQTAMDLGYVNHVSDTVVVHEQLCYQYSDIFNDIGRLKGVEVKLHVD